MTMDPTAEDSARHLLDVFHAQTMRIGQILSRGSARIRFMAEGDWHIQDFVAGLRYASQHHWIAIPSPTVLRLTQEGMCAYQARETASSPSPGLGAQA